MLRNYIKIAWRNLLKNRFHSVLNISGLAIGLGFTFLIAAYVWSETKVNKELRNIDNQYIIQSNWKDPDMGYNLTTAGPLAKALKEQYPAQVAAYYRWDGISSNVSRGDKVFREGLQVGDSTLLQMYGFELLHGDVRTALKEPYTIVISEQKAIKFFGRTDVVGQTLTIESFSGPRHDFMITGVMKTPPYNSVLSLLPGIDNEIFIPLVSLPFFGRDLENWNNNYIVGLVELNKGVDPSSLEGAMQYILQKNAPAQTAANMGPHLVPLKTYYLEKDNGLVRQMLYTVSFIAGFILLMAVINFVNVSIGKSGTRIREIGVRKVMGGLRRQLIFQFLTEAVIVVMIAAVFSLAVYQIANPFLSSILNRPIPKLSAFPLTYFLVPFFLALIIGSVAGMYPALVLSGLNAVDSVKGKLRSVQSNITLRKTLVGFQFFTASIVLIGALIASEQVSMFFSRNLGYEKEHVVFAQVPRNWSREGVERMITIRNEFANMPQVSNVSLAYGVPDGSSSGHVPMYAEGKDSTQSVSLEQVTTDERYLQTFGIPMVAGRFLNTPADSLHLVINETAVKAFGWRTPEDAIGQKIYFPGNQGANIIGVTKDFHFYSMKDPIKPIMFTSVHLTPIYRLLAFKLHAGNVSTSIDALQKKWSVLMPGAAFQYSFMDETLAKVYQSEIQLKKASQIASVLALVIVMLGVIGLVSLSIQKRIKEIGIRKVLGASVSNIASLFLKDFLPVIMTGGMISIPAAWWIMRRWLNDYHYRISITPQPFIVAIVALILVTAILIAVQVRRAAVENPVTNLRTE